MPNVQPDVQEILLRNLKKQLQLIIVVTAAIPPIVFILLKLKMDKPWVPLVHSATANLIGYLALLVYLAAWVRGANLDLDWQTTVLKIAPGSSQSIRKAIEAAVGLLIVFSALCYATSKGAWNWLFLVLLTFWIVNVCLWRVALVPTVGAAFDTTIAAHRSGSDGYGLARAQLIRDHAIGEWQWWRFGVGFAMVLACCCVAWWGRLRRLISEHWEIGADEKLLALMLLVFVVLVEGWIWERRLSLSANLSLLDDLATRGYTIAPTK